MCLVITAHTALYLLDGEWLFWYGILHTILNVFGPCMFMFLSAVGVVFSAKSDKVAHLPESAVASKIIRRGIILIFFGAMYNLALGAGTSLPWYLRLWGWSIIFAIGWSQIFTYLALKMRPIFRVYLAFIVLFFHTIFFDWLMSGFAGFNATGGTDHFPIDSMDDLHNGFAWVFFFVYQYAFMEPVIPWVAISLIGSIIGEKLLEVQKLRTVEAYKEFNIYIAKTGGIFFAGGILSGLSISSFMYGFGNLAIINGETAVQEPYGSPFHWQGISTFLIQGSIQFILYSIGAVLILLSIAFYILEVKQKRHKLYSAMELYGVLSLTIFFVHQLLALGIPKHSMNGPVWLFFNIGYIILNGVIVYIWGTKLKAVGTLEWMVVAASRIRGIDPRKSSTEPKKTSDPESNGSSTSD